MLEGGAAHPWPHTGTMAQVIVAQHLTFGDRLKAFLKGSAIRA